jgi:lipoprotein signal peptidase
MPCPALVSAPVLGAIDPTPVRQPARTRHVLGIALLIAVVALDQATKAWAWRHAPDATINTGSTNGLGGPLNGWFSGRVTGAILDCLDFGLLSWCGFALARRPRQLPVSVSATLMLAGWSSNLLDRLGMHTVTAPGSIRGAVDFIPLGPCNCNVADIFIAGATIAFLTVIARPSSTGRSVDLIRMPLDVRAANPRRSGAPRRARARSAAIGLTVAVALCVDVSIGVVRYEGLHHPRASARLSPVCCATTAPLGTAVSSAP